MSPIFKSGAFIQQCFSVHPLCLGIKRLALPDHVIVSCTSCHIAHRLTLRGMETQMLSQPHEGDTCHTPAASQHLTNCVKGHRAALGFCGMDVTADSVELRCAECRRTFALDVSMFETHHR